MLAWWACVSIAGCGSSPESPRRETSATGLRYLGGDDTAGFERALAPRVFQFPEDHGPHPEFRSEWWYFTGNLATDEGRHFGFELTFFRYALQARGEQPEDASKWRANQFWMAHFALTDTESGQFTAVERFARDSLGVAGARASPLRVWVEDWSVAGTVDDGLALTLAATDEGEEIAATIELTSTRAPVLHGDRGLDRKGPSAGNASYYYSMPRLDARGTVRARGEEFEVEGLAWLDREWSTSALEGDVEGWDWFALHLSDGSALMFYRLREAAGGMSPFSGGTFIAPDGEPVRLDASAVRVSVLREWRSAVTGVRYPVAWRLEVPAIGVELRIEPYLDDQELRLAVRYWEGAVRGSGDREGERVSVQGYLELAGY